MAEVPEVVLDASAVIAVLSKERGDVRATLRPATISAVNYAEVVAYFASAGATEDEILSILSGETLEVVPFDTDLARAAGMLRPVTRLAGLSLADRACLALARKLGLPAMTADRAWAKVEKAVGIEILLIR